MRGLHRRQVGFGLVEVLVALTIVAVNAVAWTATLQIVLSLVRRVGELANGLDPTAVAVAACGLGCLLPRPASTCGGLVAAQGCRRRPLQQCRGVSLVELLVALAVGALVLGGLAATTAITGRAAREATQALDAATVRGALPALIREVVETAGRGMPNACGLAAAPGAEGIGVGHTLGDGSVVFDEVFAGIDGGGRPALYLRRVPHVRQPWVEDVTAFSVVRVEVLAGDGHDPGRVERLVVRVVHDALDQPLDVAIDLPHRPCLDMHP